MAAFFQRFKRLSDVFVGYLSPGDTPTNQRSLHRGRPDLRLTPQINGNGKRLRPQSGGHAPDKRFKTPSGTAASLSSPSIRIVGDSGDESLYEDHDDDHFYEQDSDKDGAHEWDFINKNQQRRKDSPVHDYSATRKLLSHFASPEYKKRLSRDKTNVQPDKAFDEADLKSFEIAKVRVKRQDDVRAMREMGWAEDPIRVYLKLTMRGWEPLFPKTWRIEFDSFPRVLFTNKWEDEYIHSLTDNQFRAMRAFRSLVMVGSRARDATLRDVNTPPRRQPQELIARELKNYIKWAFADAGVTDITPTLAVISGREDVDPEVLQRKMVTRLTKLKQEWLNNIAITQDTDADGTPIQVDEVCEPPTIYGIIISHLMVCLVALEDEDNGAAEPRIHAFSWNSMAKPAYDVWNTITMAIMVMHCRNTMLSLKNIMNDFDRCAEQGGDEDGED
ncbi:hypothetical protein MPH_09350 [Macrophomina phaseolina MS6]|uniref:Uncharacterized protein n=1 Tax=Macrophomina phaseolina (strain MS6) TaxID=1126212 RepID=K2RKY8_MACPH|nr:hypothetical protein MPH_09350 [Macrophomina phaseolina MS6]